MKLLVVAAVALGIRAEANPISTRLTVDYVAPIKSGVIGAPADHISKMRDVIEKIGREVRLPRPLKISYRECGSANSFYRPQSIEICHELWDERRRLYRASGLDEKTVEEAIRGAMTFTFFHELGHALHRELALPIVGRYEDAADEIATITLIGRGLGDAAAHAALGHYLRSRQPRYYYDVTDEHGSAGQRGFAIACLLYGSNPDRYKSLIARMNIPSKRLAKCRRDYSHRATTWSDLLQRHAKR